MIGPLLGHARGMDHLMESRDRPTPGHPLNGEDHGPFVPLLITLGLLALIVFVFWFITATSMASVGAATGSG